MGYLGYKPADKPLTSADITDSIITSAKITDGTIANADINSSAAIAYSKLSLANSIAIADFSATGTKDSTTFLRGDNTFATPAAGAFVFLAETSASNVATVDLNGYFTSTYDYYQIYLDDMYTASNAQVIRMQFATTGSYTVQTSGYYSAAPVGLNSPAGSVVGADGVWNVSSAVVAWNSSSTSTQVSNAILTIFNPMGSNVKTYVSTFTGAYSNIAEIGNGVYGGRWNNTTAITGIRFFANTGNMYARKIRIYGIKNS